MTRLEQSIDELVMRYNACVERLEALVRDGVPPYPATDDERNTYYEYCRRFPNWETSLLSEVDRFTDVLLEILYLCFLHGQNKVEKVIAGRLNKLSPTWKNYPVIPGGLTEYEMFIDKLEELFLQFLKRLVKISDA